MGARNHPNGTSRVMQCELRGCIRNCAFHALVLLSLTKLGSLALSAASLTGGARMDHLPAAEPFLPLKSWTLVSCISVIRILTHICQSRGSR